MHLLYGREKLSDAEGIVLPNLSTARAYAEQAARDMLAEKVRHGEIINGESIEIADQDGVVLAIVPLISVMRQR
jgi:hypothetical protein